MCSLPAMYIGTVGRFIIITPWLFPRKVQGIIRNDDQSLSPVSSLVCVLFLSFLIP